MKTIQRILMMLVLTFAVSNAWALDLQEAKAGGLVGEANTGYLAAVQGSPSAEVEALISSVNARRKSQFEQTAKKTNTTTAQVSNRFYELAVQKTKPGHYYQDRDDHWKKK
jgi:uncharacterized protein YdbL (DUF1318 family)